MLKGRYIVLLLALLFSTLTSRPSESAISRAKQEPVSSATTAELDPAQSLNKDFNEPRRLLQQGKYDEAIAKLRDIEEKHPGTKGLSHELGIAYYKKGDYRKPSPR